MVLASTIVEDCPFKIDIGRNRSQFLPITIQNPPLEMIQWAIGHFESLKTSRKTGTWTHHDYWHSVGIIDTTGLSLLIYIDVGILLETAFFG